MPHQKGLIKFHFLSSCTFSSQTRSSRRDADLGLADRFMNGCTWRTTVGKYPRRLENLNVVEGSLNFRFCLVMLSPKTVITRCLSGQPLTIRLSAVASAASPPGLPPGLPASTASVHWAAWAATPWTAHTRSLRSYFRCLKGLCPPPAPSQAKRSCSFKAQLKCLVPVVPPLYSLSPERTCPWA